MALSVYDYVTAKSSEGTYTITSPSISLPDNSAVFALVTANYPTAQTVTMPTPTNTGTSLTWTKIKEENTRQGTSAAIFRAWNTSAQTVTVTENCTTPQYQPVSIVVVAYTGAEQTFTGATNSASNASGTPTCDLTTTANGSDILAVVSDWANVGTGTAGSGETMLYTTSDADYSQHNLHETSLVTNSGTTVTVSLASPSGENYNMVVVEVVDANPGGPGMTYVDQGTVSYSTGDATPAYPASITAGDLLVLVVGTKPQTSTMSTPAGWTAEGSFDGTTGTTGIDTGPMRVEVYTKVATGSESGTLTVTNDGNNSVSAAQIFQMRANTGNLDYAVTFGEDTSGGTSWSATCSSPGSLAIAAGDLILFGGIIPTDVTTPSQFSAETVTLSGVTFGTTTEIIEWDTPSGQDMGGFICRVAATSGSGTGSPVVAATAGGTTTNVYGPSFVLRVRDTGSSGTNANAQSADATTATANPGTSTSPTVQSADATTADATATGIGSVNAQAQAATAATATADAGTSAAPTAQAATASSATVDAGTSTSPTAQSADAATADGNATVVTGSSASPEAATASTAITDAGTSTSPTVQSADAATADVTANSSVAAYPVAEVAAASTVDANATTTGSSSTQAQPESAEAGTATADAGTSTSPSIEAATATTAGADVTSQTAAYTNAPAQSAEVASSSADAGWTEAALAQVEAAAVGTGSVNAGADKNAQPVAQVAAVSTSTVDAGSSASPTVQVASVSTEPADVTAQTTGSTNAPAQTAAVASSSADAGVVTDHQAAVASADVSTEPADATTQVSTYPVADAAAVASSPADPSPGVGPTVGYAQAGVAVVNATVQIGHMVDAAFADAMAAAWDAIARTAVLVGAGVAAVEGTAQDAVVEKIAGVTYRPYAGLTSPGDDGHIDRPDTGTTVRPIGGAV